MKKKAKYIYGKDKVKKNSGDKKDRPGAGCGSAGCSSSDGGGCGGWLNNPHLSLWKKNKRSILYLRNGIK